MSRQAADDVLGSGIGADRQPPAAAGRRAPGTLPVALGIGLVLGTLVLWLLLLGRPLVCPCGDVRFWQGEATPAENSQQFSDWYSALHAVFGMGLFVLVSRKAPEWSLGLKLLAAVAGSAVWEAIENVPLVIALFNEPADPFRYRGDSVLNALGDTLFVALGFLLASRLPLWAAALLALAAEIAVWAAIDDGFLVGTWRILRGLG